MATMINCHTEKGKFKTINNIKKDQLLNAQQHTFWEVMKVTNPLLGPPRHHVQKKILGVLGKGPENWIQSRRGYYSNWTFSNMFSNLSQLKCDLKCQKSLSSEFWQRSWKLCVPGSLFSILWFKALSFYQPQLCRRCIAIPLQYAISWLV